MFSQVNLKLDPNVGSYYTCMATIEATDLNVSCVADLFSIEAAISIMAMKIQCGLENRHQINMRLGRAYVTIEIQRKQKSTSEFTSCGLERKQMMESADRSSRQQ